MENVENSIQSYSERDITDAIKDLNQLNGSEKKETQKYVPTQDKMSPNEETAIDSEEEKRKRIMEDIKKTNANIDALLEKYLGPMARFVDKEIASLPETTSYAAVGQFFAHGFQKDGTLGVPDLLASRNWEGIKKYAKLCVEFLPSVSKRFQKEQEKPSAQPGKDSLEEM